MRIAVLSLLGCLAAGAILLAAGGVLCSVATAATFTVNATADAVDANPGDGVCETAAGNGVCTLRAAIQETNALPGADAVHLPAGTYLLALPNEYDDDLGIPVEEDAAALGDLDITDDLDVTGAGAGSSTVDADAIDRVFHILSGATVTFRGMTIRGGQALLYDGGGILNHGGDLTVTACRVTDNEAWNFGWSESSGGGIANGGTLAVSASTIDDNWAVLGGGIASGASATATITDSTVRENWAGWGGGIFGSDPATLTVTNSTISGNWAWGLWAAQMYWVGTGGGILGTATLVNCTVSGNSASDLSGTSPGSGGGLGNFFSISVPPFVLKNTIVASNGLGGDCGAFGLVLNPTSLGNNLDSDGSCELTGPGDLSATDPMLGPLGNNGGPTFTHPLLAGSPAIDSADDAACPATDQRGVQRPQGAACDMGAYENNLPCGDGVLDAGEECDDGNTRDGDCCSVTCHFEPLNSPCDVDGNTCSIDGCDGAGTCVFRSNAALGVPCEVDGDLCTIEHCDGSGSCISAGTVTCQPANPPCEAGGACNPASGKCASQPDAPWGTACEADGDLCTNDHCDGYGACVLFDTVTCPTCERCDPGLGSCVSGPKDTCYQPAVQLKALLVLKNGSDDTKDRLIWRWTKGEKTEVGAFGHPDTTDAYALCIYEAVGGSPGVLLRATAPAGGQCAGRDCWRAAGDIGFRYKDRERTPDGLDHLLLKSGDDGRSKVIVKGRGAHLALPSPLDVQLPLTVQLEGANGECWSASYFSEGVKRTEADLFKAKAGSPSGAFLDATTAVID